MHLTAGAPRPAWPGDPGGARPGDAPPAAVPGVRSWRPRPATRAAPSPGDRALGTSRRSRHRRVLPPGGTTSRARPRSGWASVGRGAGWPGPGRSVPDDGPDPATARPVERPPTPARAQVGWAWAAHRSPRYGGAG